MISGAQAMVECLLAEGCEILFGYPGATIAPFYDAMSHSKLQHILTRTEQGAGHAASGYARISGRAGVCVVTSGPGATNLFTSLATAFADSIPMIAITGQVATEQLGHDVFQEVDTTGACEPFTKHSYLVKSAADLPRIFKEAFYIATTGRKGPVVIDVPVDVQRQMIHFAYPEDVSIRGYKPRREGHSLQIKKVADAIRAAKRPVVYCGGGVHLSDAKEAVRNLCETAQLPVISTLMGLSILPATHPLFYGMPGQSGCNTANTALQESDLLVLVGVRVGDRAIARPAELENNTTIVHIDIDNAEIGKNLGPTIPLVGDAASVLTQLAQHPNLGGEWGDWIAHLDKLRVEEQPFDHPVAEGTIAPGKVIRMICDQLPDDAVYIADVGQNQIWSARNFTGKGRFLTTGGMGTMGYSIPAAVGAKMAKPSTTVIAVCGDGSFQMSLNELSTMQQWDAPIKLVVMRNNKLGMVREIQQRAYEGNEYAVALSGGPDISLIAAAYGIPYFKLDDMENAAAVTRDFLAGDGPCLLECIVDPKEVSV